MFLDSKMGPTVNVVKSGKVKRLHINKEFLKQLDKNVNKAISLLGGINLEIASNKGLVKDASKDIIEKK